MKRGLRSRPSLAARHPRALRLLLALTVLLASSALAAVVTLQTRSAVPGWAQRAPPHEPASPSLEEVRARFARAPQGLGLADYQTLAHHLLQGWAHYRTPDGARAHYPGLPSQAGRDADGLEGLSRMLPLAAVLLARGEDPVLPDAPPGRARMSEVLRAGLIAGADPEHPAYWGDIRAYQAQYVEAADIALGVWIAREALWEPLTDAQRQRLALWLSGALAALPFDGNWQMFPLLVHRSLQSLGWDVRRYDARMQTHWERLMHLHRGGGWFQDPPHGIDYYSAWGVHFSLYWIRRMDPAFGGEIVPALQGEMASFLRHLIGPRGHPAPGRSTCYRMALPAPLLASLHTAPGAIAAGQALRALDLNWAWFIDRGALQAGAPTAGLCRADPALQAKYSGPASCLWSTRALVLALDLDRMHPGLLDAPRDLLPAEREAYTLRHGTTGWTVRATPDTGHIELLMPAPYGALASPAPDAPVPTPAPGPAPALQEYRPVHRWAEWVLHRPLRPDNTAALYQRERYSTTDDLYRGCRPAP
jgi:hypothetical protein